MRTRSGESEMLEFKGTTGTSREVAKTVSAVRQMNVQSLMPALEQGQGHE